VTVTVAIAGALASISACALLLALTFRITHWIRHRFGATPEISWCFLVATWSSFGAFVVCLFGVFAPALV
jgi:hypothetical protein